MDNIILKAENLKFSYDDGATYSLNGVSLEIKRGKKIAVMGANGSGKSTFFLCCNGIHKPESGTIYFNSKKVDYSRKSLLDLRSKVGIVFQDPDNQLFSASVFQEISFGILNKCGNEQEAKIATEKIMEELEITPFANKPTHALSGGQKKQVSIADILVMKPELIILDEPTSALDPKHSLIVNEIIDSLTENGITVMTSTHNADYALEWADDVILFHEGKILKQGTAVEIFNDEKALATTNLTKPTVLQMYESLKEKNLIDKNLEIPKNLKTLTSYIENM
ncbi:MAG: ABC transporter ATP-binding protein [Clostridia bacterium]